MFVFMVASSSWKGRVGEPWLHARNTPVIIKVCFVIGYKQNVKDGRLGGCQLILVLHVSGKFYDYVLLSD